MSTPASLIRTIFYRPDPTRPDAWAPSARDVRLLRAVGEHFVHSLPAQLALAVAGTVYMSLAGLALVTPGYRWLWEAPLFYVGGALLTALALVTIVWMKADIHSHVGDDWLGVSLDSHAQNCAEVLGADSPQIDVHVRLLQTYHRRLLARDCGVIACEASAMVRYAMNLAPQAARHGRTS